MAFIPSVEDSAGLKLLPVLLSLIAGCVDVIGYLWRGTFVAHITGNLILVAARVADDTSVGVATILSVPIFVVMLGLINTGAVRLEAAKVPSLRTLLAAQFRVPRRFLFFGIGCRHARLPRLGGRCHRSDARCMRTRNSERACSSLDSRRAQYGRNDYQLDPVHARPERGVVRNGRWIRSNCQNAASSHVAGDRRIRCGGSRRSGTVRRGGHRLSGVAHGIGAGRRRCTPTPA